MDRTISTLEGIAIERAAERGDAGQVAGVETEERREHSLLQVEVEMRGEKRQDLERGVVMKLADDPFTLAHELGRQSGQHVVLGPFAIDLDQVGFGEAEAADDVAGVSDLARRWRE